MKKKFRFVLGLACIFILCQVSCNFDVGNLNIAGNGSGKAVTVSQAEMSYDHLFEDVDFFEDAIPMIFGPSATGGCSVVKGGYDGGYGVVPPDAVQIRATGGSSGGKIAGSEDGITFYFREVDASKNFIMEADFQVIRFGSSTAAEGVMGTPADTTIGSNGQEGWGIMVRDWVPENGNTTIAAIQDGMRKGDIPLSSHTSTGYRTGTARGGDSNMILVGGVKRGSRVYYRRGVQWNGDTPLRRWDEESGAYKTDAGPGASGNPVAFDSMNHSNTKFSYLPSELGDYSVYGIDGNGNVVDPPGPGVVEPTLPARPEFPEWGSTWKVRVEKTRNGFHYRITAPDGKGWVEEMPNGSLTTLTELGTYGANGKPRIPLYDICDSVNKEKYYVGIFAARDAAVWVSNIVYKEADAEDCEPFMPQEPEQIRATLDVLSPMYYTGNDYLYVKSNIDGELVVVQDGTRIPSEVIFKEWVRPDHGGAVPHTMFIVPTLPHKDGNNVFSLTFYPNRNIPRELVSDSLWGKVLASATPLRRTFIVTKKLYNGGTGDIWISPNGRAGNDGSRGSPLDLETAINYVQPGQTVRMQNGKYLMNKFVAIPRYNDGRYNAEKTLKAENRNKVFIDFNKNELLKESGQGFLVAGSYWVLDGFHVRNTPDKTKGIVVGGYNNTLRYIMVYNSGDTGLQLSGNNSEPKRYWPSGNTIEYCESFNNMDAAQTDADGFAAKLTVGNDNKFLWCISHNNNDDGWDLFTKKETGPIGIVRFFGNVSYNNRTLLDGHISERGAGNGYKLGGEDIAIRHEVRHSVSFLNDGGPFTNNSNPNPDHYFCTAIASNGTSPGAINAGSQGKRENCVYTGSGGVGSYDYNSILFTYREAYGEELEGIPNDVKKFMKRKEDGRPDFRDVYKPGGDEWNPNGTNGTDVRGAWAFYLPNKPEPDFIK